MDLAELLLDQGRTAQAGATAREALILIARIRDRDFTIWTLTLLARLASHSGDAAKAGWLWGVIEAEGQRAPVTWGGLRDSITQHLLTCQGQDFDRGRREGQRLSLWEAVEHAAADPP